MEEEQSKSYSEITKEVLFQINANVKIINQVSKIPKDDEIIDYTNAKNAVENIARCIECLSTQMSRKLQEMDIILVK